MPAIPGLELFDLNYSAQHLYTGLQQWNQALLRMTRHDRENKDRMTVLFVSLPASFILGSMEYSSLKRGGAATQNQMTYDLEEAILAATLQLMLDDGLIEYDEEGFFDYFSGDDGGDDVPDTLH